MKKTYQGAARQVQEEVRGASASKELAVELPLPMVEVWEELQARGRTLDRAGRAADHPGVILKTK